MRALWQKSWPNKDTLTGFQPRPGDSPGQVQNEKILHKAGIDTPQYQELTPEGPRPFIWNILYCETLADDASHGNQRKAWYINLPAGKQARKIGALFGAEHWKKVYDGREFNTTCWQHGLIVPAVSEITYNLPPDKPEYRPRVKWGKDSVTSKYPGVVRPRTAGRARKNRLYRHDRLQTLPGSPRICQVDFRQATRVEYKVLEVKPTPDITPGSERITAGGGRINLNHFKAKLSVMYIAVIAIPYCSTKPFSPAQSSERNS
jgi:hypothetical protein